MSIARFAGTTLAAFVAYMALYGGSVQLLFAEQFASMAAATVEPGENALAVMSYHLVQTIVVVWLFDKAVGSDDMKAGAIFGLMIGLYIMASDSIWFTNLKDFPQDARVVLSGMHLVIGAIVGVLLAKLHSVGRGGEAADAAA